jgi:hypothetical protein
LTEQPCTAESWIDKSWRVAKNCLDRQQTTQKTGQIASGELQKIDRQQTKQKAGQIIAGELQKNGDR